MRLKFIVGILGLATLCILGVRLVPSGQWKAPIDQKTAAPAHESVSAQNAPSGGSLEGTQAASNSENASPSVADPRRAPAVPATHTSADDADAKREAYVEARTAELQDLARKSDPASLATLLSEVRNPDLEIREAALDALSQSGNRGAIPGLEQAAAQTENSKEKRAIQDVIEFLKLPTLTETLRGQSGGQGHR
jgi:hypothetical protein